MENLVKEMKLYAERENVPIIEEEGLEIVEGLIVKYNVKSILEIGTAIGFSAIRMHQCNECQVTTIERDAKMYSKAVEFVKKADKKDEITLIFEDALLFDSSLLPTFDMLYIDAAKGQYKNFFEKYLHHVKKDGIIIFDNLLFHGFVNLKQEEIKNRNTRQLIRKLKAFIEYISNHPDYEFEMIKEGDGIGIARRK